MRHFLECTALTLFFLAMSGIADLSEASGRPETYPRYFRLRFDRSPSISDSGACLWERRVLSDIYRDSCWAEESTATDTCWHLLAELPRKVKVGLALGGGGLRGAAHIGVLRAFEENSIPIDGIAGTSMGAIVGGFYACGYSVDTLEAIVMNQIDWQAIFRDQPPRQSLPMWARLREKPREPGIDLNTKGRWWGPFSYVPEIGIRVAQNFTDEVAKRTLTADYQSGFDFENLSIPFGAIVTNAKTGKSELLTAGTISTATRASGSAPIYLEPMRIRGVPYVDGAILDDLPVDAFIPFDPSRRPEKLLKISDSPEALYVIAVYPLKRRGAREVVEDPSLMGPFGLGVMGRTRSLARDIHLWNSWDAAQGKIDVDVEGFFDFTTEKIGEVVRKGYDAAWKEAGNIKREIAALDDSLHGTKQTEGICRVASIEPLLVSSTGASKLDYGPERKRILDAVRFKEGSYVDKIDVCAALRRVYNLGDYADVTARVDCADPELALSLLLRKQETYTKRIKVVTDEYIPQSCDSAVEAAVAGKRRALNFNEVRGLVEPLLVSEGFVSPRVSSVRFSPSKGDTDTLAVHFKDPRRIKGLKVVCNDTLDRKMGPLLQGEFGQHLGPDQVLSKAKYVQTEYQLKTISVEGIEGDSLMMAVRKKSTHTLEFPALSLEIFEGFNFFTEIRNRRVRRLSDWSYYANYAQNFPIKVAEELPEGMSLGVGTERGRSLPFIPDVDLRWKTLRISSAHLSDTVTVNDSVFIIPDLPTDEKSRFLTNYDAKFTEYSARVRFPLYKSSYALIPGFEAAAVDTYALGTRPSNWQKELSGTLHLSYDDLDRMVFPESGWKLDIDGKADLEDNAWQRASARLTWVPFKLRIQKRVSTFITVRGFGSWYSDKTPYNQRYSMGGIAPSGSYQLRLRDSEELPGHAKEELVQPLMWKAGGSARLAFLEREFLGLRVNAHVEGSAYIARAIPRDEPFRSNAKPLVCPSGGIYLDTSYGNMGFIVERTDRNVWHHLYLGVVLYGLGL